MTAFGFVDPDVVSTRSRRRQPSPAPLEPVDDSSDGEDYPAVPPSVPTFGNGSAPLRVLIAWRSEVVAAGLEYDHAVCALEAAKLRRRDAWRNFYQVLGLEVAANPRVMGAIIVTISGHCPAYFCALYPAIFNNDCYKSRAVITILSTTLLLK